MRILAQLLFGWLLLSLLSADVGAQRSALKPNQYREQPISGFSWAPVTFGSQLRVQFCIDEAQPYMTRLWKFGDGTTSTLKDPLHTFPQTGTYTVELTVSNGLKRSTSTQVLFVADLPEGFVDDFYFKPKAFTTGFHVLDADNIITWNKAGRVWLWSDGSYLPSPLLDISEEVGSWGDHGLMRLALDPDFDNNGHLYVLYVVDRYHLDNFGLPGYDPNQSLLRTETTARLTRYTVGDLGDPSLTVDPSTRLVLLGKDYADAMPICSTSHGVGGLEFGEDGSLLLTLGDAWQGDTYQDECLSSGLLSATTFVRSFRAQHPDSPNGKLLRIDPQSGQGLPDNPFYDPAEPNAWRSRVWTLGLRNPYSFTLHPSDHGAGLRRTSGPGTIFVADVGSNRWEELNVVESAGVNLGFPLWEGMERGTFWEDMDTQNLDAPNPLFGAAGCNEPFFRYEDLIINGSLNPPTWPNPCDPGQEIPAAIPRFVHQPPAIAWLHGDRIDAPQSLVPRYDGQGQAIGLPIDDPSAGVLGEQFIGNAAIAGTWMDGGAFPEPFDDVLFNADYGEGWIKAFEFDDDHNVVAVYDFTYPEGRGITFITKDPAQQALYYLRFPRDTGGIHRIAYDANARPLAAAQATPRFGAGPLRVEFSAAGSIDPEGDALQFDWDFGDSQPSSPLNAWEESVHLFGAEDITSGLTVITNAAGSGLLGAPSNAPNGPKLGGRLSANLPLIHDGSYPDPGSTSTLEQELIQADGPWIGYRIFPAREVAGLIFQEGLNAGPLGGSFQQPVVETYDASAGRWLPVAGLQARRSLPGDPALSYESFELSFDPVRTNFIRLRELQPGVRQVSLAELRVLASAQPANPGPLGHQVTLRVSDSEGLSAIDSLLVSTDNTPPMVTMTSPAPGQTYPVGAAISFPMTATVSDAEHDSSELSCEWSVELVHDNHAHPEPLDLNCDTSIVLQPHSELQGDVIFWRFTLKVTDAAGLSTSVTRDLIPAGDCNLNGILDATDISGGFSQDLDMNGVPDECE